MKIRFVNKWAWVYLVVIICLIFTVIPGWIPFVRKEWHLLVLGTIASLFLFGHFFVSKSALCLYSYFIILFLNRMSGDIVYHSLPNIIYEVLQYLVPSAVFFYMFKKEDTVFARTVVVAMLVIICIESVASYFINLSAPNIIRELEALTRAEGDRGFAYSFMRMGLADYSFCHALPVMIPPLICWIKESKRMKKWILCGVLFLTCLLIYISASGTAILLMVFMIVLGLFTSISNKSNSRRSLIVILIVFAPFLFSQQLQFATIDTFISVLPQESYMTQKLESIRFSLEYEASEGDVEARVVRYNKSIDALKENVLFGSNKRNGGHSAFLDRLSNLGLVGIAPLIFFFIIQFAITIKYIPKRYNLFYIEGVIAAMMIFLLKAVSLVPLLILSFIVLPFMLIAILDWKQNELTNIQ